ncbi:hypothetical protein JQX13_08725 [Archangium violaceum]|uniref:hypothetical protein n=1 Tax=Archangium violaceum TaxID=83451 RepID=UPI00193BBC43|nr:hypothetical protein [Archangium violaceum]QRK10163.1 hypothetical protein JQX13_08725 [Archangium violaceum]
MSETIDPKNPRPQTRREVLERGTREHPVQGGPMIHTTATEPLPDIVESNYREELVRETPANGMELRHRGVAIGAFTMVLISSITFFIPGLNALLGGLFGGFFARRWGRAFAAAAIASVAVPALFAFLYGWDTPDMLYLFYGLGFWGWSLLNAAGMFIGAAAGVYSRPLAERRRFRREISVR